MNYVGRVLILTGEFLTGTEEATLPRNKDATLGWKVALFCRGVVNREAGREHNELRGWEWDWQHAIVEHEHW